MSTLHSSIFFCQSFKLRACSSDKIQAIIYSLKVFCKCPKGDLPNVENPRPKPTGKGCMGGERSEKQHGSLPRSLASTAWGLSDPPRELMPLVGVNGWWESRSWRKQNQEKLDLSTHRAGTMLIGTWGNQPARLGGERWLLWGTMASGQWHNRVTTMCSMLLACPGRS